MGQPEGRKSQQDETNHRAQALPAWKCFLHDHHPSEQRHLDQAAHPETEHD